MDDDDHVDVDDDDFESSPRVAVVLVVLVAGLRREHCARWIRPDGERHRGEAAVLKTPARTTASHHSGRDGTGRSLSVLHRH